MNYLKRLVISIKKHTPIVVKNIYIAGLIVGAFLAVVLIWVLVGAGGVGLGWLLKKLWLALEGIKFAIDKMTVIFGVIFSWLIILSVKVWRKK